MRLPPAPSLTALLDNRGATTVLYLLIAFCVHLPGLGSTGLVGMEAMTATTAGRMLAGGDLLVPELYGEIYTYKPPLAYWLVALSMRLFGPTEWAVRLPGAALSLAAGLVVLALVTRASRPRTGLVAALATVTSFLWIQKARLGDFDVILASFVGVAVAAAWHNLATTDGDQRAALRIWLLCYLALTGGFLTKGMPALMAYAPGLLVAGFLSRRTGRLGSRGHLAGAALFLVLVGIFLALVWHRAGAAGFAQPLAEAQHRGLEWTPATLARTLMKPLVISAAFLPWSLAWPFSLAALLRPREALSPVDRAGLAIWGFLGGGILAFMAVPTHETRYYLPLGVPAAIAAAIGLERTPVTRRWIGGLFAAAPLAFGGAAFALAFAPIFAGATAAALAATGVATLILVGLRRRVPPRLRAAYLLLAGGLCAWAVENAALRPHRGRYRVHRSLARELAGELPPDATVWAPGIADIVGKNGSLFHYLDRPVRTFALTGSLPPPGSWVLLTASEVRALEGAAPKRLAELELIRRLHDPWRLFLLYRVTPPAGAADGLSSAASNRPVNRSR